MAKRLLLIDDEQQMLYSLKPIFENAGYTAYWTSNKDEVWQMLDDLGIDMVISDLRLSHEVGVELLMQVKQRYPRVLRIALSGYTDSKQVYHAIESNLARLYLFKPWDDEAILQVVESIFFMEAQLHSEDLLAVINSIDVLPTVPHLYLEVSRMVREDAEIERIAQMIEQDPALAARILRVANSAFYGAKTGSIIQAIMFIGLINVKNIILSNSVFSGKGNTDQAERLWQHAGLTNRFTHMLYERVHMRKMPMVNSSAGLLHNVGIVLMLSHYKEEYMPLLAQLGHVTERDLLEQEQAVLGSNHAQLGGYLLDWWELPHSLVEVAMYHHNPISAHVINKDIVAMVHFACHMAWFVMNRGIDTLLPNDEELKPWGLDQQILKNLIQRSQAQVT